MKGTFGVLARIWIGVVLRDTSAAALASGSSASDMQLPAGPHGGAFGAQLGEFPGDAPVSGAC